jgi:crotonobetainyl-CoA:carnitine CoA-transferase CaiB-like acyl-CoA transferase
LAENYSAVDETAVPVSALENILVVDLSRVLAGPLVAMTLGDLGAEVIKVESPLGDDTRHWTPPVDAQGRSSYHHAANRNKRSIVLDLKCEPDLELARTLCERADVVISNFKPGTLERFGLDYEVVSALNDQVVYCEISGFGEVGGRDMLGYDPIVQAVGGLMSITGPPDAASKVGVAIVDIVTALYGTIAVLAALYARRDLGLGQRVTVDLLSANLAMLANQSTGWLADGSVPGRLGNVHPSIEPFATYRARDGELMLGAGNDGQFRRLAEAIGAQELADDPRFSSNEARVVNRDALRPLLEEHLGARSRAEWREALLQAGVPAGPVQTIDEAFSLAERLGLDVVDDTDGVRTVRFPALLSETPAATRRRPPDLDEHSDEIRGELGR